jgi:ABC-type amino acid transport system permease subunit
MVARSRITGLLTCGAALATVGSLRFSATVAQRLLADAGSALPRPTFLALAVTRPAVFVPMIMACVIVVAASEINLKTEANRLSVHVVVLLLLVVLLAACLVGFFISFHIPDVHIP